MSLWSRVRAKLGGGSPGRPSSSGGTSQVQSGRPEDAGGTPDRSAPDRHSTTGTTPNQTPVGRVSGDDSGYLETGAEKRAEGDDETGDTSRTST